MSDRYVIFIEVHSHNVRHFFHQQRRAVIGYDRNTGYFETVSLRILLELIQPDLDIKTIVAELVYVFLDVFNLAFHAFAVFCYVLDRPYRTVLYFFEITFWDFSISFNLFWRSGFKRVYFLVDFLSDIGKKFFCPQLF